MKYILLFVIFSLISTKLLSKKFDEDKKPDWAKKDIRDYNDADLERLLDQWEEDEEPLEPDELPEHLRPAPKIDFSKISQGNPEDILKQTKKGRTLMTFVNVAGNPTKDEAETITKIWQTSLWNNHIQAERYMVDTNRAIFLFKDGEQAWIAKDYLIEQEQCESVTIENKIYEGKHLKKSENESKDEL